MTRRPINNDKILYLKKMFLLNDKWRWSTLLAAVAAQTHADSSFWLQNMRLITPVTFQYLNNITVGNSCNLLSDFLHLNSPPGSLLASNEGRLEKNTTTFSALGFLCFLPLPQLNQSEHVIALCYYTIIFGQCYFLIASGFTRSSFTLEHQSSSD